MQQDSCSMTPPNSPIVTVAMEIKEEEETDEFKCLTGEKWINKDSIWLHVVPLKTGWATATNLLLRTNILFVWQHSNEILPSFSSAATMDKLFTARKRSLGQGDVFTPVCHSVHGGRGVSQHAMDKGVSQHAMGRGGVSASGSLGGVCLLVRRGVHLPLPRRVAHWGRRYTYYWNAFLFILLQSWTLE